MSTTRSKVIDGVEIPERLIAEEAQNHPSDSAEQALRAAGHALAIRALLLDRAHQMGLEPDSVIEEDGREETPEEALIRAVLDSQIRVSPPDAAECRRVYDVQRAAFRTPTLTEASHILISPNHDTETDWDTARKQAEDLITRLADPLVRFSDLAKAHSACSSASLGGSLGQLSPGDLTPTVEAALAQLAPGTISTEPVRSRFGWHVLRLDRRIDGRELPFEHVHDQIALHLESRAWTAAATRFVAELASEARSQGIALRLTEEGRIGDGALSLGDLLQDRNGVSERVEAWLDEADPPLSDQVRNAATAAGATFAGFVRDQICTFVADADDERWTQLISATQGTEDPALGCVRAILKGKLQPAARAYTLIKRT